MSPCSHPTLVWNLASSFATKWILLPLCVRWSAMVCATSSSRLSGVELMAETLLPRRVALQLSIRWLCPSVCLCLKMLENHGKHWLIVSFPRFPVIFPNVSPYFPYWNSIDSPCRLGFFGWGLAGEPPLGQWDVWRLRDLACRSQEGSRTVPGHRISAGEVSAVFFGAFLMILMSTLD